MLPQGKNCRTQHIFTYYNICVLGAASVRGWYGTYRVGRRQDDTSTAISASAADRTPDEEAERPQHEEAGQGGKGGGGTGPHRRFVRRFVLCRFCKDFVQPSTVTVMLASCKASSACCCNVGMYYYIGIPCWHVPLAFGKLHSSGQ